ncbi:hypothetical protein BC938DRAFT_477525, partial [Jimgerdemannia flammicorona]
MYHKNGLYWMMYFDTHPTVIKELLKQMLLDSQVVWHTIIKIRSKLEEVVKRPDKSIEFCASLIKFVVEKNVVTDV